MGNVNDTKKSKKKTNTEDITKPKGVYASSKEGIKSCSGQDSYHHLGFEVDGSSIKFIGVYDGHGEKGREASSLVSSQVGNFIIGNKTHIKKWVTSSNGREVVTNKFKDLYKKIHQVMKKEEIYEFSGTCCISALIVDKFCYVINLGDSRAVIGSRNLENKFAIQMSIDHKPKLAEEEERIVKAGGEVKNDKDGQLGPYRVYKQNESNPGLAVSRSIGDCFGHECGVSEEPQVSFKIIDPSDEFVVIGSDGIWDVMNSVEIVGYVFERLELIDRDKIADEIVEECFKRWTLINKFKDNANLEKIRNDKNLSETDKKLIENDYLKRITIESENSSYQNLTSNIAPTQIGAVATNPSNLLTGRHNIDDITCIILFFKIDYV